MGGGRLGCTAGGGGAVGRRGSVERGSIGRKRMGRSLGEEWAPEKVTEVGGGKGGGKGLK